MRDGFIKVAVASPTMKLADPVRNADEMIALARQANSKGVRLVAFPELSLTGYTCGDLFLQSCLLQSASTQLLRIAEETSNLNVVLVVGVPFQVADKLYNCAAVLCAGQVLGIVPKTNIPNYSEFYERRQFAPAPSGNCVVSLGGQQVLFGTKQIFYCREMPGFRIGVEICEDLWVPTPPSGALALAGANVIVNASASNETVGKASYRRALVTGQSARLYCGYLYASASLGESSSDLVFAGHNMIAENGTLLAESTLYKDSLTITELDLQRISHERMRVSSFVSDAASDFAQTFFSLPMEETKLTRTIDQHPFIPSDAQDRNGRCQDILSIQAHGLARRAEHTHCSSLVIGISGGLDSCLALLVAVRAMDLLHRPRTDVIAVTMPCFGTTSRTKSNAEEMCRELGVTFREVPITEAVRCHFRDIGHDESNHNVVYENTQARERTQVLMDIANAQNGLVVGTGDLSELALGWATYNGDHMSMYGVNASIPKTLVRHIVQYVADTSEPTLAGVLNDILDTPVSPELLPAQEDDIAQRTEDIVGPYDLHDFYLYYLVRFGFSPRKVYRLAVYAFDGVFAPEVILKWLKIFCRRFFNQQFKRNCLPDGPKVGSVSLSPRGDWRMPSDAFSTIWLQELEEITE